MRWILITLIASIVLAPGCQSAKRPSGGMPQPPARINHLAFFKLKNPVDAAELIHDCDTMLATIPGVVSYYAGRHLDTGRGNRVDSSYDVGFYVGFETEQDYSRYVEHPSHVTAVNKWQPRWEWIRVYDVLDDP